MVEFEISIMKKIYASKHLIPSLFEECILTVSFGFNTSNFSKESSHPNFQSKNIDWKLFPTSPGHFLHNPNRAHPPLAHLLWPVHCLPLFDPCSLILGLQTAVGQFLNGHHLNLWQVFFLWILLLLCHLEHEDFETAWQSTGWEMFCLEIVTTCVGECLFCE